MSASLVYFDDDGLAHVSTQGVIELAYQNKLGNIFEWQDASAKKEYMQSSQFLDNFPFDISKPDVKNRDWFTPAEYSQIDLDDYILSRCTNNVERVRAQQELVLVHQLNAAHIFKHLIYLIDQWRSQDLVWGVGRGSSVSCFLLYVIGLNKINPLEHDLDYHEFFKFK